MCLQENGIYVVAKLILPQDPAVKAASLQVGDRASCVHLHRGRCERDAVRDERACCLVLLQCYAFRTLRFLFSVERNRALFRR